MDGGMLFVIDLFMISVLGVLILSTGLLGFFVDSVDFSLGVLVKGDVIGKIQVL
jgi:hypothetical protein